VPQHRPPNIHIARLINRLWGQSCVVAVRSVPPWMRTRGADRREPHCSLRLGTQRCRRSMLLLSNLSIVAVGGAESAAHPRVAETCGELGVSAEMDENERSPRYGQAAESARRCGSRRRSGRDLSRTLGRDRRCASKQRPGVSAAARSNHNAGSTEPGFRFPIWTRHVGRSTHLLSQLVRPSQEPGQRPRTLLSLRRSSPAEYGDAHLTPRWQRGPGARPRGTRRRCRRSPASLTAAVARGR
jgi:hypothetical protein